MSGPHDFAVRVSAVRPRAEAHPTLPRPPHPASNVRDDRETPLWWEQDWFALLPFLPNRKAKSFPGRDWTTTQISGRRAGKATCPPWRVHVVPALSRDP